MTSAAAQLVERTRSQALAEPDSAPWQPIAANAGDFCTVVNARKGTDSSPDNFPENLPQNGMMVELWKTESFQVHYLPAVQRCLAGEEMHFNLQCDLPRHGTRRFEINLFPHQTPRHEQAIVLVRDVTERDRAISHLQLLLEIVHLLSASPDLSTATRSILEVLCAVSNWPVGEVWLPAPDGSIELFNSVCRPDFPSGNQFHQDTVGINLRNGSSAVVELWNGGPAFVSNLDTDPALFRARAARKAGLRSAFVIPLKHGNDTFALMIFFLSGEQGPGEHWMSLARAVSSELGSGLHSERMQEQLDTFFTRSVDLHCVAGSDGLLTRVNPAWTRTLGYSKEELLKHPIVEFVHAEDRPFFLSSLTKLGQGEELTSVEVRCVGKDGLDHWIMWNATSLPSQHIIIATGRDITHRKITEAAVLQSEEHYRDLFHQAYQMQENLRKMSDRVLKIQEHERSRISRDLHDEVGQALTAINMNLTMIRNSLVSPPVEAERRLAESQMLIEQTMVNIHNFSRELRPAMLDDLGLLPALRNYTKMFGERTNISVRLDATQSESIELLDSERKTVVYRIIQEGLNNVAKHAGAKNVEIVIAGSKHDVRIQLGDDGRGFSLGTSRPDSAPKQLGLLGLAERTRLVGGEFAIASVPNRGTILRATIPFKPA